MHNLFLVYLGSKNIFTSQRAQTTCCLFLLDILILWVYSMIRYLSRERAICAPGEVLTAVWVRKVMKLPQVIMGQLARLRNGRPTGQQGKK